MKFPWTRARTATTSELAAQLEHAQAAEVAAQAAVDAALASFDDAGDETAGKTLSKAREAAQNAAEHVARSERLLDAARARDAEQARQAAEQQLAELEPQLTHAAALAAATPLDQREANLLLQVAAVRAERLQLARDFEKLGREHERLLRQLGRNGPSGFWVDGQGRTRTPHPAGFQHSSTILDLDRSRVIATLAEHLSSIDRDDPRSDVLSELIKSMGGDPRHVRSAHDQARVAS